MARRRRDLARLHPRAGGGIRTVNRKILAVALAAALTLPAAALAAGEANELELVRGKPSVAPPTEVHYAEKVRDRLVKRYKRLTGDKPPNWSIKRLRREIREERRERRERRAQRRAERAAAAAAAAASVDPAPAEAPPAQGSTSSGGGATPGHLAGIAACESGGDPGAVGGGGTYRGKYQFDMQTWQSVGGSGDPAAASEAEQDQRAAQLYAQRGSAPWPTCG
jgi:soluble lytic murein transglycosylase-like protein